MKNSNIVIAGAGIAGCFLAILLLKKGYKITIYEKLSKKDSISAASKRSYNITFFGFALKILKDQGLMEKFKPFMTKLNGSATYFSKSSPSIVNNKEASYYAVSRADVLNVLLEEAVRMGCKFYFGNEVTSINKRQKKVTVLNTSTNKTHDIKCDLVVGADGVNSKVRENLQRTQNAIFTKKIPNWEYRQFSIDKEISKKLSMKDNFATTWSDKKFVIVAFPNKDKTHTGIIISKKGVNFDSENYINVFPKLEVIKSTLDEIKKNKPGGFVTIHTTPWQSDNFIVIIGDAAHGFNPFFGQGVSAALGDAIILVNCIENNEDLHTFELKRKIHMDALGELSNKGFERYRRDKKIDEEAILLKIESLLHSILPKIFVKPIFDSIADDPGLTYKYQKLHGKQRKIFTKLGINLVVRFASFILNKTTN